MKKVLFYGRVILVFMINNQPFGISYSYISLEKMSINQLNKSGYIRAVFILLIHKYVSKLLEISWGC